MDNRRAESPATIGTVPDPTPAAKVPTVSGAKEAVFKQIEQYKLADRNNRWGASFNGDAANP